MDQDIEEFIKVTSAPREQATFYLDLSSGDLQRAIALYFDDSGAVPHTETTAAPAGPPPRKVAFQRPEETTASQKLPAKQSGESSSRAQPSASSSKPKIGSLNTIKNDDSSEDDTQGQAFYAGGSEHGSGQQIVGPKKAKPSDSRGVVSQLFSAARQLGAEEVSEDPKQPPRGPPAFGGSGYRLGSTANPAPATATQRTDAATTSSGVSDPKLNETEVVLKFWSNGFSIDEGPLRAFDDPQNTELLNSIRRGDVPPELRALKRSPTDRISVRLEDHHDDDYRAPKVTVKPFTGAGQKLVSNAEPQGSAAATQVVPKKITVDDAQPATQIQLRLPDGSRTTVRCNQSSSLRDVRAHLLAERAEMRNATFTFISAFPGKPIENETQTIKDAGLLNAALVVKQG